MAVNGTTLHGAMLKTATGIAGLDSICMGGIPQGRVTLVEGGPGAGKTVLALQTLIHGARDLREPGIFVAFEESSARILANAACFGWDLNGLQKKRLFFLDAQPSPDIIQSGGFDLGGMIAALDEKVRQLGARRIVFDALDIVMSMMDDSAAERREVYRLRDWIARKGLTAILTSKTSHSAQSQQRAEFMQFMVDCAIRLKHSVSQGVSQRSLRILKYRGSNFHENEAPYLIGSSGLRVADVEETDSQYGTATTERVSSGVPRLDTMLGGGFFRGAGILTTGVPGTAKTTLGGAFAQAACKRGEPTLFVSFDSETPEVIRNLFSVGLRLGRYIGSRKRPGLLRMSYQRALSGSAETHLLKIQESASEHGARCIVIDPLSSLVLSGNESQAQNVAKRLVDWCKSAGITLFCTSLLDEAGQDTEGSPIRISTIADTWIHLSYLMRGGERNRCLSILKSRGTAHSNQMRELVLGEHGITLADAYTAGGEVLLGTLRWEREQAEATARLEAEQLEEVRRMKLTSEEADLAARMTALDLQLGAKRIELKSLKNNSSRRVASAAGSLTERLTRRSADVE
jgi:circadian clock protein KaiC